MAKGVCLMAISDFFNRTVMVFRVAAETQDETGGIIEDVKPWLLDVKCCIETATADERAMHGSIGAATTHLMWTDATYDGRIVVKDKIEDDGHSYMIHAVENPQSRDGHLVLELEELVGGGAER